jgi:hypothetical protein
MVSGVRGNHEGPNPAFGRNQRLNLPAQGIGFFEPPRAPRSRRMEDSNCNSRRSSRPLRFRRAICRGRALADVVRTTAHTECASKVRRRSVQPLSAVRRRRVSLAGSSRHSCVFVSIRGPFEKRTFAHEWHESTRIEDVWNTNPRESTLMIPHLPITD